VPERADVMDEGLLEMEARMVRGGRDAHDSERTAHMRRAAAEPFAATGRLRSAAMADAGPDGSPSPPTDVGGPVPSRSGAAEGPGGDPLAIAVRGLEKSYGSLRAVRGIDFEVNRGEVFALLGPNGAGKTTTVEILEGYIGRDAGDVHVLGLDPAAGAAELRSRVGIVLQECAIEPFLTVREVLERRAGYYARPKQPDEVIEMVGLAEKTKARVKSLSGGQQRRLDLGLAIVGNPELLFLDEPTTGFDPSARRGAWDLVHALAGEGRTVLLTTHYMDEAEELADRVAVIAGGQIVAAGTPESIGGRDRAAVQIRFELPAGAVTVDLPVAGARMDGAEVVVETHEPTVALHALTAWALGRGQELGGLEVSRPSLEDVYLRVTEDGPAGEDAR
jgi:ABC-2 type transport system ATP-binding protein